MNTLQRKFTIKNKRESDSLIIYNDDYKDNAPKPKRQTMAGKARVSGSRRSGKDNRYEGRMSSRKTLKVPNINRSSHKRSQSINKSTVETRYRSVPQNGHHNEYEKSKRAHVKKKLNTIFNNKTPQVHLSKSKNEQAKLDLSLKHAKKNLQNYFIESNSNEYNRQKYESLTGREKGNTLLRKVYLRMENEYPNHKNSYRNIANKQTESTKKEKNAGSSKNKIKATNGRFISPLFKSERSNSRKVETYQSPSSMYPKSK